MAPRAYWKGYLKLSLVSCPILLYPATSEREKIRFHQIHKETGNRVRYKKVDEETGDEVESSDIIKGYEVGKGQYLQLEPEELEHEVKRLHEILYDTETMKNFCVANEIIDVNRYKIISKPLLIEQIVVKNGLKGFQFICNKN